MPSKATQIRKCSGEDFESICSIINEAAQIYRGAIPADLRKEPYMSRLELRHEIDDGVRFWCFEEDGEMLGVMGIQDVADVSLIRHAYVRRASQNRGIGKALLSYLQNQPIRPVLIGTWAAATWAIRFYEKNGFRQVDRKTKDRLLRKYWKIPERQIETSVVLADNRLANPA